MVEKAIEGEALAAVKAGWSGGDLFGLCGDVGIRQGP